MDTSDTPSGMVCAQAVGTGSIASTSVTVTFPTGFTLGAATDFTVDTNNNGWPSGAVAWPGINTATSVSGQDVTFPTTTMTGGTLYCFNWNNTYSAVTNPSSTGTNYTGSVSIDGGTGTLDSGSYTVAIINYGGVSVDALVPETFSLTLDSNADNLGTLSVNSITSSSTPRIITVDTNAAHGWSVWGVSANAGLKSYQANKTIASTTPGTNSTLTSGTEGYNTGVTGSQAGGNGTLTIAAPFVGGTPGKGGGLDTSERTIASSDGTADTATLTLTNNVTISSLTPASTLYHDDLNFTGAGLF